MDIRATTAFNIIKSIKTKFGDLNKANSYSNIKGYHASADDILNNIILHDIKNNFIEDAIISEESIINKDAEYCWVIDPLCGTTNFLHSIPFYSHSISVLKNNKTLFSIIYDYKHNELFYTDDINSYLNKKIIKVSEVKNLSESLVCINSNQSDHASIKKNLLNMIKIFSPPVTRRIHIMESANLELAYLSCGRIDAYINFDDKVWDITAGGQLIKSAGGKVNFINKKSTMSNIDIYNGIIASNGEIHDEILKVLKDNDYIPHTI